MNTSPFAVKPSITGLAEAMANTPAAAAPARGPKRRAPRSPSRTVVPAL